MTMDSGDVCVLIQGQEALQLGARFGEATLPRDSEVTDRLIKGRGMVGMIHVRALYVL